MANRCFDWTKNQLTLLIRRIENTIIEMVHTISNGIQAILCSDYLKGVLSERVLAATFDDGPRKRNSEPSWPPKIQILKNIVGPTCVMANSRELMQLSGKKYATFDLLDEPARGLIDKLSLEALVVTRGSEGMSLFEKSDAGLRRVDIPTMARSVYDVTGAGDTAIAAFAAAVASGSDLERLLIWPILRPGIKVGKRGTASVSLEEIRQSLRESPSAYKPLCRFFELRVVYGAKIAVANASHVRGDVAG